MLGEDSLPMAPGTTRPESRRGKDGFRVIKRILPGGSWCNPPSVTEQPVVDQLRPDYTVHLPFNTGGRQGNDGYRFSCVRTRI